MQVSVNKKNLFCRHERLLRGKKSKKTKAIQIKKEIGKKQNTAKQNQKNVLNCFARAANKFRSEFMDTKYGKLAGHTLVK